MSKLVKKEWIKNPKIDRGRDIIGDNSSKCYPNNSNNSNNSSISNNRSNDMLMMKIDINNSNTMSNNRMMLSNAAYDNVNTMNNSNTNNIVSNNNDRSNNNSVKNSIGNNTYSNTNSSSDNRNNTKMMIMMSNRQFGSTTNNNDNNTNTNTHSNNTMNADGIQRREEVPRLWASKSSSRIVRQCSNCQMLFNDFHNCKLIKSNNNVHS